MQIKSMPLDRNTPQEIVIQINNYNSHLNTFSPLLNTLSTFHPLSVFESFFPTRKVESNINSGDLLSISKTYALKTNLFNLTFAHTMGRSKANLKSLFLISSGLTDTNRCDVIDFYQLFGEEK